MNPASLETTPAGPGRLAIAPARTARRIAAGMLLLVFLGGCATVPAGDDDGSAYDPFEPLNRKVFAFNRAADRVLLRPVARGYDRVVPGPVKTGVSNFFDNLSTPIWVLNHVLQGEFAEAGRQTGRFLMNSTFGLGGVLDPASRNELPETTARFDQTFGKWGIPSGPYLMVPFIGPNTPRSLAGWYARFQTDVVWNYLDDNRSLRDKLVALELVDQRYRLLQFDRMLDEAPDPYVFMREAYRQRSEFAVSGETPLEDFDFDDDP